MTNRFRAAAAALSLVAVAGLASACGSDDSGDSAGGGSGGSSTKLTVGMSFPYEPWQVGDGTTQKDGIEPELLAAIGKKAGIEFDIENVDFAGIVTGTQSGKYDLAVSGLGVYGARLKALNFVPDAKTGYTMMSRAEDAGKYTKLADLCGQKVAVGTGTKSLTDAYSANGDSSQGDASDPSFGVCKDNPIQLDVVDDNGVLLSVQTGKDVAGLATIQTLESFANKAANKGKYYVADPYNNVYFGIGIPKDQTELADKIIAAEKSVIEDGTYDEIMEKYKSYFGSEDLFEASKITADDVKLITE